MRIIGAVLENGASRQPFASSKPIRIQELELDEPGPREVLVRIEAAGVCHSDLSVLTGVRPRALPLLLGHEAAGIVEVLGSEVNDLSVGQRVVMTFLPRCGACTSCAGDGRTPCENGSAANESGRLLDGAKRIHSGNTTIDHHLGVSAFADHAIVDRRSVVPVDLDVPPEVAALMGCAVLTGGGAVLNVARLQPGGTLIVVGLGGVGMAAVLVGLAVEGSRVIGIDANPDKLAQARACGAHETYLPQEAIDAGVSAPTVIEAVGRAIAFETALALTGPGGLTVTVGLPAPDDLAHISPLSLVTTGRTIVGSYLGSCIPARDIPIFVDLWRRGRLPVEKLVSAEIHLSEINGAMDSLARGESIRQIIVPADQPLRTQPALG